MNVQDFKDLALIISSTGTLLISFFTIKKWKTEFKGKAYFDASVKFLKIVYNLRDNFHSLRVGSILPDEQHPQFNPREKQNAEHEAHVIKNRYQKFNKALGDFYNFRPEVEALFKKEGKDICRNINGIISQYRMSQNEYLQLVGNTNNLDYLAEVRKQVFYSDDNDTLNIQMNSEIDKIERIVSKYIDLA